MTATTTADAARRDRGKCVVRIAHVGYSVAILVAIFACAIPNFAASTG